MSISSVWNQYFNHYEPRQTEITKIKLATLNDVRKNWTRDISLCIKLLKCKLIQINLKRSLSLRDFFRILVKKNWYYRCLYFFLLLLFYPWATPQVPTVDQLKKDCFSPCKKMISQMSLYLPLTAISYKRLVSRLRTLNEQTLTRKSLCVYWGKF